MKLRNLLRGAPTASEAPPRRRRRAPRADGPRTIIPADDVAGDTPFALDVDAARERLKRSIPPVADDEQ
ncbi:MAG TPA: hypothetical protein VK501_19075 [Baekduia sp.]|uniref:hypothetical protein n=1 Tax=Baekduia sp. TaxID=2600305 RepID=UPI002BBAE576|nr:hypothetical protein [Baekduia sp.]HMJ36015.1 hypothetical protein [Baekduia sp.]